MIPLAAPTQARGRDAGRRRRAPRRVAAAVACGLVLAGCDIPTGLPILQSRFVLSESETTFSVSQLLPAGVMAVPGAFRLSLPATSTQRSLAALCPPCSVPAGTQLAKPAFTADLPLTLVTPLDVTTATVASGAVMVSATHNFGFDPLRPPGGPNGSLTVVVRNAGRQLAATTITDPFPSGTMLTRQLQLAPGPITGNVDVVVTIVSPAGGTVTITNPNATLTVSAAGSAVDASLATVRVQNRQVSAQTVTLDLRNVDDAVRGQVRSGALVVTLDNPVDVAGSVQLQFEGSPVAPKPIAITPGESVQRVEFTQAELQALLGTTVALSLAGPVTGTGAGQTATLMPGQQISVTTVLDLILAFGG